VNARICIKAADPALLKSSDLQLIMLQAQVEALVEQLCEKKAISRLRYNISRFAKLKPLLEKFVTKLPKTEGETT
jgi:hypothetical protein